MWAVVHEQPEPILREAAVQGRKDGGRVEEGWTEADRGAWKVQTKRTFQCMKVVCPLIYAHAPLTDARLSP